MAARSVRTQHGDGSTSWLADHPRLVDVTIAVLVFVAAVLGAPPAAAEPGLATAALDPLTVGLLLLSSGLLLVRRARPREVWIGTLVLALASGAIGDDPGRGLPAAVVALYTVAAQLGRRWAVGAAVVTMGVGGVVAARGVSDGVGDPVTLAVLPWCALAAAIGDAVRVHRRVLLDAQERARLAEQGREDEAMRRVAEERLHISRELHDVVGHHLAVINVQAGVVEHLVRTDPAAAGAAAAQVRAAASDALQQTGRLVGLLRTTDEEPRSPAPHLDLLPQLVAATRAGGAEVRWTQQGPATVDDPLVNHHAYRLVQEALTNAVRHGAGPVTLTTAYDGGVFRVEVRNPVRGETVTSPGRGHGLVGMRERAALCGGTLVTEQSGGEHVLRAELPVREVSG